MTKFATIFLIIELINFCTAVPVDKESKSDLQRDKETEQSRKSKQFADDEVSIENEYFNIDDTGNYNFGYKQSDLQERHENGTIKRNSATGKRELKIVTGSYKYLRPDGLWQIVTYKADKNGFVPSITVSRNEVSHDPPQVLGLVLTVPVLSSIQNSTSTSGTSAPNYYG